MIVDLAEKIRAGNTDVQNRQEELNVIYEKLIEKLLALLETVYKLIHKILEAKRDLFENS